MIVPATHNFFFAKHLYSITFLSPVQEYFGTVNFYWTDIAIHRKDIAFVLHPHQGDIANVSSFVSTGETSLLFSLWSQRRIDRFKKVHPIIVHVSDNLEPEVSAAISAALARRETRAPFNVSE